MKKILSVIAGILMSGILCAGGVYLILTPLHHETGKSPESLMHYSYFIIYPVSIFLGSLCTGCLIGNEIEKRRIKQMKYLPGVYVSIPYVFAIFMGPIMALFILASVLLNNYSSFIGLHIGTKLKKIS